MNDYYVNKNQQSNGDHEVHMLGCSWVVNVENFIYLGSFDNCHEAVLAAQKYYLQVNGCYYCCRDCHTS